MPIIEDYTITSVVNLPQYSALWEGHGRAPGGPSYFLKGTFYALVGRDRQLNSQFFARLRFKTTLKP